MPRGPARPWRALAPHTREMLPVVQTSLDQVGYERELVWEGCSDSDRALQVQRGIYNAASHLGISAQCRIEKTGQTYRVVFRLFDKRKARASHVQRNGTDRTKWAYNPRAKG